MWRCKDCGTAVTSRSQLLKHYRLAHGHFGRKNPYPCTYCDCPCVFKTWNALHSHLSRSHANQNFKKSVSLATFNCLLCPCSGIASEQEYFCHISNHLKSHETVHCMFEGCTFHTNVYGTFKSHKSRKHNSYSVKDFKLGIIEISETQNVSDDSVDVRFSAEDGDSNADFDSDIESETEAQDLSKTIEFTFASVLLKLENYFHVPCTAIDELLTDLQYLIGSASVPISTQVILDTFENHNICIDQLIIKELTSALSSSNPLLNAVAKDGPLATAFKRKQYYREHFQVIEPVEYVLNLKTKRTFHYIPILKSLQQLLKQKDVLNKVIDSHAQQNLVNEEQYTSYQDGHHFLNNEFLSGDELRISLCLYIDDFEICNPLGTSRKKHKLCAVYWILGNLPPGCNSSLSSIYLSLLCKSDDVKTFGYQRILEPLLHDLVTLEQQGVFIHHLGTFIKGTVQCVVADNLGAHGLAGFVESFSADYCCRFCTAMRSEFQSKEVKDGDFTLRTEALHQVHVASAHKKGVACYGVKKACPLAESLSFFKITAGFPPDVAHDLFEGIVPVELAQCFGLLIAKKYFTFDQLNELIQTFPYKEGDKTNRPHLVPRTFQSKKTVGGNAHENWCLLRLIPLIVGNLIPEYEPAWQVILDLKDIVELVVCPVHTNESIAYLESKISEHRYRYQQLFPESKLIPKHHFLEHYPAMIHLFGPLVLLWTMRFEAKHSFFKQVVRHTNCFKNITKSLANKHQLMVGYDMHSSSCEKTSLKVARVSTVPVDVLKEDVALSLSLKYPDAAVVNFAQNVCVDGINYKNGMTIVHGSVGGLPDFAEIVQMCVVKDSVAFIVKKLCSWYKEHYRSFELDPSPRDVSLVELTELADRYPLSDYKIGALRMVTLKRYIHSSDMTAPAKLLIVLGENDTVKLFLPSGIPKSVDELKIELERQCGVSGHYRLQYMDIDFDNAFVNLTSTADLQDKGKIRVIIEPTSAPHTPLTTSSDECCSLADTDVLSSPESTSSASTSSASVLRSQAWPISFPIPELSYDVQMQLMKANQEYQSNGTLLTPSPKLKSDILDALASEILKYKAYPSSAQFDDVAQALILKHPCLKEKGSVGGFGGWKISLKFKMGNYRTKLRNLGCSELSINSLKHRQGDKCAGPNQVKKPKRAEVNFCPDYPAGENKESQERERLALLSEVNKKDNIQVIKDKMEQTFALRRYEVVQDMPFIAEFKSRWPALFSEREVCAEFKRITTIPLIPKFMSQLDKYTTKLPGVFRKKGGVAGRTINDTLAVIDQNDTIATRRACHLKALAVYLNEDPGKLIKEYMDVNCDDAVRDMNQTVIGIYVVKHEGADVDDPPEDIGIVVEGVQVLQDLKDVASACALLFGIMYCLNLSYPSDLKYTFEFLQKVLMELDVHRLSNKIQILKNKLLA